MLSAETAALHAEQGLSGRLTALATALAKAVAAAGGGSGGGSSSGGSGGGSSGGGSGGGSSGGGSGGGSKGSGAGGGGRTASGGGGGSPVSAAQLAADQAAADAAAAQVTVAQENLADATVVSPISGTVISVSATAGATASAGSTAFVIAGLDSYEVMADVPVTDMPQLEIGERATAQPDGSSTPLPGTVVSIGLIPDSTGSPTTYPVTIGLTGPPSGLHPDGFASVTITTARSTGVSVPTSAVHRSGHQATVTVYAGGRARVTKVKIGTMGPEMTRITAGLRPGEQVVLANLNQPLPNNNPTNQGPGGGPIFLGPGFHARVFAGPPG